MVYMVTVNIMPVNKASEIAELYLEVMKKYPDDKTIEKPIVRSAIWASKEGYYNITISSIKPGKVKEVMDLATNRELMLSTVEGYRFEMHIAYELGEALSLIGLKAPE